MRSAKDAIAAGEAIQIVVARRQTYERPVIGSEAGGPGRPLDAVTLYRSLRRINPSPTCSSSGCRSSPSSAPAPSCSFASRATA